MSTVATPMAARSLRADVAGSVYGFMTESFDATPLNAVVSSMGDVAVEKRVFLVGGQRVTIRIEVAPIV